MEHYIKELFERSIDAKRATIDQCLPAMVRIAGLMVEALRSGGKIMFCGNGGSAGDAQHLAAELLVRLRSEVNRRPLASLALTLDTSSLTACANDYSYEEFYARMVEGLGKEKDLLVGITTSGKSANIVYALKKAREMNIRTVGFLGCGGGPALSHCDEALVVPCEETGRVQEVHITAGHAILELVEEKLKS